MQVAPASPVTVEEIKDRLNSNCALMGPLLSAQGRVVATMGEDIIGAEAHAGRFARCTLLPLTEAALRLWDAYWRWRLGQATVRLLRSMDARQLRDIGVDPSEINSLSKSRELFPGNSSGGNS